MKISRLSSICIATALCSASGHAQTLPPPEKCFGVIELGAKGIKAIVVEDMGRDSKGKFLPPVAIKDGEFKPKNLDPYAGDAAPEIAAVVQELTGAMIDKLHVPPSQIYAVMSSGIPGPVKKTLESRQVEMKLDSINVETEARLVFQGIVPLHRMEAGTAIVLDIGSGNSKGCYLSESPDQFACFSLPLGTSTFTDAITELIKKEPDKDRTTAAAAIVDRELLPSLERQVRRMTGMQNCNRLYLAGGLPYVMTTLMSPEKIGAKDLEDPTGSKDSDWVNLDPKTIYEFCEIAMSDPARLLNPEYGKNKLHSGNQQEGLKELAKVKKIFNQDQLRSGATLLKLFMDKMNARAKVPNKQKEKDGIISFSRRALYAWPQGYVREKLAARP